MPPITITTTGRSEISRPAERAILRIEVRDTGIHKTEVSNNVLGSTRRIKEMIEPLNAKLNGGEPAPHAAITHWTMDTLHTRSYPRDDDHGRVIGHEFSAAAHFAVKFKDFSQMASVATDISSMPYANISGIAWQLTDATRQSLMAKSRGMATEDARERATDYVRPFGKQKLLALEIDESRESYLQNTGTYVAARMHGSVPGGRQDGDDELSFHPEDVSFSSAVTVKFTTE
ncbi:hypothetical protein P175DRAFT_0553903 [Aspergillus ochraceoroseus IBT 24754]|uniref:SIMPL domain-containing protein n=2 Tax=Aspergillus ochraceoroseus TaxID=138278 RepID=A0A2T5M7X2_9EURO|nr:uncharacterized protein P175DRAFT_0553903 [Aspergillus ochraceoroseus IBT 24754]KKK14087.1 hypothetical protein AOCH_000871 [Aspergillus ochraceoroseus]PTU24617.1 hypothetical protein P175DRAFT_0553903 [Aspergillus ochraceoroseus IBT 24754]